MGNVVGIISLNLPDPLPYGSNNKTELHRQDRFECRGNGSLETTRVGLQKEL